MSDTAKTAKKKAEPWVVSSFSIRPEMAARLDEKAQEIGIPRSALMRMIIDNYLNKK